MRYLHTVLDKNAFIVTAHSERYSLFPLHVTHLAFTFSPSSHQVVSFQQQQWFKSFATLGSFHSVCSFTASASLIFWFCFCSVWAALSQHLQQPNSLPTSRWLEQQLEVLFQWKDNVLGPTFVMRHHTCLRIDLAEGWLDGLRCRCTDRCRFEQDCLQRFEVGFTVNAPHVLLLWPLKPPGSTLSWH